MWPNPLETADLVTFTEEILNGKLYFSSCESLCFNWNSPQKIYIYKYIEPSLTRRTILSACKKGLLNELHFQKGIISSSIFNSSSSSI